MGRGIAAFPRLLGCLRKVPDSASVARHIPFLPRIGYWHADRKLRPRSVESWWAMTGSNRRPFGCKPNALPAELIARDVRPLGTGDGPRKTNPATQNVAGIIDRFLDAVRRRSVDGVLQALAGFELRLVGSGNRNLFAGARIAALCRFAAGYGKCTKPYNANFLSTRQRAGDRIENAVHCFRGVHLGETGTPSYGIYEIIFIHVEAPFSVWLKK